METLEALMLEGFIVSINSTSEEVRSESAFPVAVRAFVVSINSTSEEVRSAALAITLFQVLQSFH